MSQPPGRRRNNRIEIIMDMVIPFVEVNELRRSFRDIEAVAGASFTVDQG